MEQLENVDGETSPFRPMPHRHANQSPSLPDPVVGSSHDLLSGIGMVVLDVVAHVVFASGRIGCLIAANRKPFSGQMPAIRTALQPVSKPPVAP
jgi:hypothetical protein